LTGEKIFNIVKPIGSRRVPATIQRDEATAQFREMNDALTREAVQRRAKHPPRLETKDLDLGAPMDDA
jgi:hypothetical protein